MYGQYRQRCHAKRRSNPRSGPGAQEQATADAGLSHAPPKADARRGFQQDDELLQAVQRLEMALHEMHIATHYLTCGDTAMGLPNRHCIPSTTATSVVAISSVLPA